MTVWDDFAAHVADLSDAGLVVDDVLEQARLSFLPLLQERFLPAAALRSSESGSPWLLHQSEAMTVFLMSSPPGYVSSVHDHRGWGLVGQVLGEEVETRYRRGPDEEGLVRLEVAERRRVRPGEVVTIVPPAADIHQVVTLGSTNSVTVHAFAHDLVGEGFSLFEPALYSPSVYRGPYANAR